MLWRVGRTRAANKSRSHFSISTSAAPIAPPPCLLKIPSGILAFRLVNVSSNHNHLHENVVLHKILGKDLLQIATTFHVGLAARSNAPGGSSCQEKKKLGSTRNVSSDVGCLLLLSLAHRQG